MSQGLVGSTVKSLRKERKLTLKDLATETGLSISFLSQVERGKSSVTLESLKKIADALHVNPSVFFAKDDFQDDFSVRPEGFFYKDLSDGVQNASFAPILVSLQPKEHKGNAFSHDGHEFLFVVEGLLTVEIDGKSVQLNEQQSILFDARKIHYWYNHTDQIVRFIVVSSKS